VTQPTIDPVTIKSQQRRTWDAVSVGWEASAAIFERYAAGVSARLLDLAGVRPGQSVLDIGTGIGEPALSAARVSGPAGRVLGIDLSPAMIDAARRRAAAVPGIEYRVADFEDGGGLSAASFDVALSRWGLMFAVDHIAAFRAIARLLKPGGVLAAAVWGPPDAAPVMAFGFGVLSRMLELPPPPPRTPGPFSMADASELSAELSAAGYVDVTIGETVIPFRFRSPEEYVEFSRAIAPPFLLDAIRQRTGDAADPTTWQTVRDAARERFADGTGLLLPSTALYVRAGTPG
jgi:SAM-dependent methyltransferase